MKDDVLFREMQRAILANDVPRCEAAANKLGPHEARGAETMLCGKLQAVRLVHDRLEAQLVALMIKSLPPPPR